MAKYKRIGYFDDREDIEKLADSSVEEIVKYMESDSGSFHPSDDEDQSDFNDFDPSTISGDDGDMHIVQSSIAVVFDPEGGDDFIDVYEKVLEPKTV